MKGKLIMDNMLSKALREFTTGPLNQLLVNMGGKDGDKVSAELDKFNRKEPCWTETPNGILMPDDNVTKTMNAVARLSAKGYLDTSFDGRAVHTLVIRPLSKKQAFSKYRKSGGKIWVWNVLEEHMQYQTPKAQLVLAMNMQFSYSMKIEDILNEMDELNVQPFGGELLIQYGCAHPDHQKKNSLVALGAKFEHGGDSHAPGLGFDGAVRGLGAYVLDGNGAGRHRFPVVCKGIQL